MVLTTDKKIKYLIVDTTAFIQNESLLNVAENIYTVQNVVDEVKNKRQLKRLCVLPYELVIKDVFPESVKTVTEFSKKTGDYPSLSATDIKVMALAYQLEKEQVGVEHLRKEPLVQQTVIVSNKKDAALDGREDFVGFYYPGKNKQDLESDGEEEQDEEVSKPETNVEEVDAVLKERFAALQCEDLESGDNDDVLVAIKDSEDYQTCSEEDYNTGDEEDDEDDDDSGWITPSNVKTAQKNITSQFTEEKSVIVACMTTDFAMQNVLKQMNLNVAALDGRLIKQLRTFILRCYTCFQTTSIMTSAFCKKCGNNTMKRVAVSLDENGKQQIHVNGRKPLTARGMKFSLPTIKGGKYSKNPILVADQPMPHQKPTRIARTKNNPMNDEYLAGYSPFVMRDVNSKSAQLKIRATGGAVGAADMKHWMKKNPNEARRRRK